VTRAPFIIGRRFTRRWLPSSRAGNSVHLHGGTLIRGGRKEGEKGKFLS